MAFDSKALVLVLKKEDLGVGPFLRDEKGRIDNRIVLLGQELRKLDKIKQAA